MANIRAAQSGNWSATSTWVGGVVPVAGDNVSSSSFTVTIDTNVIVANITNGTLYGATIGGSFVLSNNITVNADFNAASANASLVTISGTNSATINGNLILSANGGSASILSHSSSGTLNINGNISSSSTSVNNTGISVSGSGTIIFNGNITGSAATNAPMINISSTGSFISTNLTCLAGAGSIAINCGGSGNITISNSVITAVNGVCAITSSGTNRFSGTFISSTNGTQPFNATRFILGTQPLNAYIQHALDGINPNSYVRFYTADNNLGQANPTDVRSGVSYASGNLTGRLTIPARGTVANGVNLGPSMPFTATRSGTTATATLAYSYPYQVGDVITVTGASNNEWNGDYTIASVISGTSVTFTVPNTHSATAGTGAAMQTKGTAVLDGSSVAAAVWGAASRTLTSASGPTAVEIRQEMDTNSTKLANLDATVSSRLAASAVNTTRLANVATVESTGAALAAALTAP